MSRTRPKDRLDALVAAATTTFLRNGGPDRTQMQDVARALGVAKGTLYLYVEGKEALFDLVIRHADEPGPVAPPVLPVPNPAPGALAARVADRIQARGRFPALQAALSAPSIDAPAVHAALAQVHDVLSANRTAIRLINIAARDRPDLAEPWFAGARGVLLQGLTQLIERGVADGTLRPVPDTGTAARVVVETCMWFAVHRPWDPRPDGIPDATTRATALHMLAGGLGLTPPAPPRA